MVFGLVAVFAGIDLFFDLRADTPLTHLAVELIGFAVGIAGSVWMAMRFRALVGDRRRLASHVDDLAQRLEASNLEGDRWRREASDLIAGLGEAIDRQLDRWNLSPAEKEVALLLLKGLSHKDVGRIRGVSEATVRQQARSLYDKAGLSGRHDLAAFFLEDLLDPHSATQAEPRKARSRFES